MREMYRDPGLRLFYRHSVGDGEVHLKELAQEQNLTGLQISGSRRKPMRWLMDVAERSVLILASQRGTMLVKDGPVDRVGLLHDRSVMIAPGPLTLTGLMARGTHEYTAYSLRDTDAQALISSWDRASALEPTSLGYGIQFCSGSTFAGEALDQLAIWSKNYISATYGRVLGALLCLGGVASAPTEPFSLCSIAIGTFPEPIQRLLDDVRQNPREPWSLKNAAAHAGYSPFHLSRAFKSAVGFGFPEFVERCRVESAIPKILGRTQPLDAIGIAAGFSSAPAMRDAFRENLGLLPSEFRSFAVEFESALA